MGIGFLDFLDDIENKVKNTKYKPSNKEYDFNDDEQEVLLDMADIMP